MSDTIERQAAPVARMYPTNGEGVIPVPDSQDPNTYLSQSEVLLYTPFMDGPNFRKKRITQLQYLDLANAVIMLDAPGKMPESPRDEESRNKFYLIGQAATQFWPAARGMYLRQVQAPKRDMGHRLDITPEMGTTMAPPRRKIDSPTLSPTTPKPR